MSAPPIERVLGRLSDVRRTGPGRWVATCPAHADKRPSLSVREGDDGRALLYCFAGCAGVEIIDALRLEWSDLFPERIELSNLGPQRLPKPAPPIRAEDALEILDLEALTLGVIAGGLGRGVPLDHYRADLAMVTQRVAAIRQAFMERPR